MDVFRQDVATKRKGSHVQEVKVHGIVGEGQLRYLVDPSMEEIEFGDLEMMNQGIPTKGWCAGKQGKGDKQSCKENPDDAAESLFF
ncbi:MAG: hypothetical protein D3910_08335 [Candidatus Electrothrix sp. ATG2]|nr:hypothetical protein [Candidatus Electrothrix sp. ATG2]